MGSAAHFCGTARLRFLGAVIAIACGALLGATGGSAGLLGGLLTPCTGALSKPFLPWLDVGNYALAPNGDFEGGSAAWTLGGGARVGSGNESFLVGGAGDAASLSLPSGGSALSSGACVGTLSPTIRFFAHNTGDRSSTLRVDAVYTDALGLRWSVPIASLGATAEWQPTAPILILANVTALPLLTGSAQVAFRFAAQGRGGAWQVDDVYVDPYKGT